VVMGCFSGCCRVVFADYPRGGSSRSIPLADFDAGSTLTPMTNLGDPTRLPPYPLDKGDKQFHRQQLSGSLTPHPTRRHNRVHSHSTLLDSLDLIVT
jgi:hypothetical protein